MAEYHNQSKLRFWCQMVLPLVYDDSLSYMELLNKVVTYLNNCIQDVANCETNIESLLEAFVNLQDYVNDVVEDLSPLVEEKIDEMIESGEFGEILADALATVVAPEYDSTESYVPLNYAIYNGTLYCCTGNTTGEWDSTKWRETTVGDELNTLMQRVFALNAGQVSYDESATYSDDTVGKELKDLKSAINTEENIRQIVSACNLLPFPYTASSHSEYGITFTANSDGSITINGTATADASWIISTFDFGTPSFNSRNDSQGKYSAHLLEAPSGCTLYYYQSTKNTALTVAKDTVVNNVTVYPMICLNGENVTEYRKYTLTNAELMDAINALPFEKGKKYKICCGILRNSGSGWGVINDTGHSPMNIAGVAVNSDGDIEVTYSFTSRRIKTFVCSPDETFAQTYRFGASVGDTSAKISIIKLPEIIGGMTQYDATNQIWTDTYLNGMHYESSGYGIVQMRLNDNRSLVPFPYDANHIYALSVECRYSIGMIHSIGQTEIQFKCFDPVTGTLIGTNQWQDTERAFISWNLPEHKINASDLVSALGNIWFFGLFEVA